MNIRHKYKVAVCRPREGIKTPLFIDETNYDYTNMHDAVEYLYDYATEHWYTLEKGDYFLIARDDHVLHRLDSLEFYKKITESTYGKSLTIGIICSGLITEVNGK